MSEISRKFAQYALSHSDFSQAAIAAAKTFILDSLGVGIAGAHAPFNQAVYKTVMGWGQSPKQGSGAHLWGRGAKAPAASAAYLNGFQIHSMEYDCVHEAAVVHPMATILAALSAEAESLGHISGRSFIEAVIIAVDIAVELGVAVKSPLKFFRPATAGLFGATLGIARLRGFNEAQALSAMGCALAQCAGVMQAHVEGKPTLPVQIAGAARAALIACDLTENGLWGPESALEGPYGYFAMFEDEVDVQGAAQSLGQTHRITEVSWKPFPTGRAAQGGIVLVQKLRAQGVTLDNLKQLILSAPPIIPRLVDRPIIDNMSANYARLCFPYLAQVTLMRGTVSLSDFTQDDLRNTAIKTQAQKIKIELNHIDDPAAFTPQSVTAHLHTGETLTAQIKTLFGAPNDPLTVSQHLTKFKNCIKFGFDDPVLSEVNALTRANRLIELIDNLELAEDCGKIFAAASVL